MADKTSHNLACPRPSKPVPCHRFCSCSALATLVSLQLFLDTDSTLLTRGLCLAVPTSYGVLPQPVYMVTALVRSKPLLKRHFLNEV